jgi:hypothetical protein
MASIRGTLQQAIALTICGVMGCTRTVELTPPPAASPAWVVAQSGASVMIGAGDIASCLNTASAGTAHLVDSVMKADSIAKVPDVAFTLGDNVYESGTAAEFAQCFTPTWGDPNKRLMRNIRPTPGNHDYYSKGAAPYFAYFGKAAGDNVSGYYSYDVGEWHMLALNSEIIVNPTFNAAVRAAQLAWVEKDLAANKKLCTLAYWHNPRFSSGWHGSNAQFIPLWELLIKHGVELVLNGHDHDYERFRPMNAQGVVDTVNGITQIVAGTGGDELRRFEAPLANSAARVAGRAGVLLLVLGGAEYRTVFLEVGGRLWDPSGGKCH